MFLLQLKKALLAERKSVKSVTASAVTELTSLESHRSLSPTTRSTVVRVSSRLRQVCGIDLCLLLHPDHFII